MRVRIHLKNGNHADWSNVTAKRWDKPTNSFVMGGDTFEVNVPREEVSFVEFTNDAPVVEAGMANPVGDGPYNVPSVEAAGTKRKVKNGA